MIKCNKIQIVTNIQLSQINTTKIVYNKYKYKQIISILRLINNLSNISIEIIIVKIRIKIKIRMRMRMRMNLNPNNNKIAIQIQSV